MKAVSPKQRCKAPAWLSVVVVVNFVVTSCCFAAERASPNARHEVETSGGVGHKVKVKLTDGRLLHGKVVAIEDASFGLDQGKPKGSSTLSYAEVAWVRSDVMSRNEKIGIVVVGGVAVAAVVIGVHAVSGGGVHFPCAPGSC